MKHSGSHTSRVDPIFLINGPPAETMEERTAFNTDRCHVSCTNMRKIASPEFFRCTTKATKYNFNAQVLPK